MFKTALIQICSSLSPQDNLSVLEQQIRLAHKAGAQFILTPEVSNIIDRNKKRAHQKVGSLADDATVTALSDLAKELQVHLLAGSLVLRHGDELVNRSLLFARDGNLQAGYDKMHMFDVDLPGGESYRESNGYRPGNQAVVTDLPWGRLGLSVCYDLRFAALYRRLAQAGADFLAIPAAFTKPTGKAHWHALLRARAIETGCYVFAPAQSGSHEDGRKTYGHSMIIAPWGEIVAEAGEDTPEILCADIDPALVKTARRRIPALTHDRVFAAPAISEPARMAS